MECHIFQHPSQAHTPTFFEANQDFVGNTFLSCQGGFQPIWKNMLVRQIGCIFPMKIKNISNHHPAFILNTPTKVVLTYHKPQLLGRFGGIVPIGLSWPLTKSPPNLGVAIPSMDSPRKLTWILQKNHIWKEIHFEQKTSCLRGLVYSPRLLGTLMIHDPYDPM